MNRKMKYIFGTSILVVFLWMVVVIFTKPGIKDLEGSFRKLAYIRNEQNTGPVIRVYAVSVSDTLWDNMAKYGNYMPHTKYGSTKVYFFLENTPAPEKLYLGKDNIDPTYKRYCIALYENNAMSQVELIKYPFMQ